MDVPDEVLFGYIKWPEDLDPEMVDEYKTIIRTALTDMEFVAITNGAEMPPIQSAAMRWALIGMSMAIPAAYEAATGMERDWYVKEADAFTAGWKSGAVTFEGSTEAAMDSVAALAAYDEWKKGSAHDGQGN